MYRLKWHQCTVLGLLAWCEQQCNSSKAPQTDNPGSIGPTADGRSLGLGKLGRKVLVSNDGAEADAGQVTPEANETPSRLASDTRAPDIPEPAHHNLNPCTRRDTKCQSTTCLHRGVGFMMPLMELTWCPASRDAVLESAGLAIQFRWRGEEK